MMNPGPLPISPLSPRALNRLHLERALEGLMARAGFPSRRDAALAFAITDRPGRPCRVPGLRWMAFEGVHAPFGLRRLPGAPGPGMGRPAPEPPRGFLHLGAWLEGEGGFRIPLGAPGRILPGCCPLARVGDGFLEDHLVRAYRFYLLRP